VRRRCASGGSGAVNVGRAARLAVARRSACGGSARRRRPAAEPLRLRRVSRGPPVHPRAELPPVRRHHSCRVAGRAGRALLPRCTRRVRAAAAGDARALPLAGRGLPPRRLVAPLAIPARAAETAPTSAGEDYAAAVERALRTFERDLEGLVRFERAAESARRSSRSGSPRRPSRATTPTSRCSARRRSAAPVGVEGGDPASSPRRALLRPRAPSARRRLIRAAAAGRSRRIALHELGHALGMRTHSPIPADLMYPVVRDRLPRGELGTEDVNSFLALYSLPNGSVYRVLPEAPGTLPDAPLPEGPPEVELAPHVDPRLGYEIQLPRGWTRLERARPLAVDGTTDYESLGDQRVSGIDATSSATASGISGAAHPRSQCNEAAPPALRAQVPDGAAEGRGRVQDASWWCSGTVPRERAGVPPWFDASDARDRGRAGAPATATIRAGRRPGPRRAQRGAGPAASAGTDPCEKPAPRRPARAVRASSWPRRLGGEVVTSRDPGGGEPHCSGWSTRGPPYLRAGDRSPRGSSGSVARPRCASSAAEDRRLPSGADRATPTIDALMAKKYPSRIVSSA
jgi:hypothetical protein